MSKSIGCLMCDVEGTTLSAADKEVLAHPAVGGVILFSRHYENTVQIKKLIQDIRQASPTPLLVAVDQEGGRVQRFKTEFTEIPAMRELGEMHVHNPQEAAHLALGLGAILAAELHQVGVDLTFAPVLDLDYGNNKVIGDRSFARDPEVVSTLALSFIRGLRAAGMEAVGKHFPGHGFVEADSHFDLPKDSRSLDALEADDIIPYQNLFAKKALAGVMTSHILFEAVDKDIVTFSKAWLRDYLREKMGYDGAIFSDDLDMKALQGFSYQERAHRAVQAGCDMVLFCNNREGVELLLDDLSWQEGNNFNPERLQPLYTHHKNAEATLSEIANVFNKE